MVAVKGKLVKAHFVGSGSLRSIDYRRGNGSATQGCKSPFQWYDLNRHVALRINSTLIKELAGHLTTGAADGLNRDGFSFDVLKSFNLRSAIKPKLWFAIENHHNLKPNPPHNRGRTRT